MGCHATDPSLVAVDPHSALMTGTIYSHRFETSVDVNASPAELFEELDDHERLSAHMMQSSPMMAGSAMRVEFDDAGGRSVGSRIRMWAKFWASN